MSFMLRKCFGLIFRNYCSHSSADMVKVLNVAEKNDAAKTLANVMSRGSARKVMFKFIFSCLPLPVSVPESVVDFNFYDRLSVLHIFYLCRISGRFV